MKLSVFKDLPMMLVVLILFMVYFVVHADSKKQVKIGGIFHDNDPASQMAFRYAVKRNNLRSGIEFVPLIRTVSSIDSYKAEKLACNLTSEGVMAIFGPESRETRGIVESICKTLKIPNFQTFSSLDPPQEFADAPMALNFYPDHQTFEKSLADLVVDSDWESFSILYEDNDGLRRIQKVLENLSMGQMTLHQLTPGESNSPIFEDLANTEETHIIMDCSKETILEYLRQARDAGMLEPHQTYILTSLDAHTVDYGEFQNASANITAFRVVYGGGNHVFRELHYNEEQAVYDPSPDTVTFNSALMIDAVNHLTESLNTLLMSTRRLPDINSISCQTPTEWALGKSVYQYIADATTKGMTGDIRFKNSQRESVNLEIVELNSGVIKIGDWNVNDGISHITQLDDMLMTNSKVFVISSRIGEPYLQLKIPQNGEVLEGNDRYEGYSMDLMNGISDILNISFVFELAPDNQYGAFNTKTRTWTGIMGELIGKRAQAGVADITINPERLKSVDFTIPFMDAGIGLLYNRFNVNSENTFSFLQPFSSNLWTYIFAAYIAVSLILYILTRISSKELCKRNSDFENKGFEETPSFFNCIWMPMANLLHRGGYIMSRNISSRMAVSVWWFFTIIVVSFYTANLAAFRIKDRLQTSEATMQIDDLPKQNMIKYGVLMGGSTSVYFKNSEFSQYRRIWEIMNADPSNAPASYNEGVDRVKKSKGIYAFFMETTALEYFAARDCSLTQLGNAIAPRSFGIAMPFNSPYRSAFSGAILKMRENGRLEYIKRKWWSDIDGRMCLGDVKVRSEYPNQLDLSDMGGIFVVLLYGVAVAVLVAFLEFLLHVKNVAKRDEITVKSAFHKEWSMAINICVNTRPVYKNAASTPSHSQNHQDDTPMKDLQTVY